MCIELNDSVKLCSDEHFSRDARKRGNDDRFENEEINSRSLFFDRMYKLHLFSLNLRHHSKRALHIRLIFVIYQSSQPFAFDHSNFKMIAFILPYSAISLQNILKKNYARIVIDEPRVSSLFLR